MKIGRLHLKLTEFEKFYSNDESLLEDETYELLINCADLFTIKLESTDLQALLQYFSQKQTKEDAGGNIMTEDLQETPQKLKHSNIETYVSINGVPES